MNRINLTVSLCAVLVAFAIANTGCSSMPAKGSLASKMPWSKKNKKPEPYPNPARMATTWTPDTLVQTGRTPTRGFGGRLFFYDEKTRAVPVEGELTVHAFAEGADGSQGEVKRYHFTPEQFTQHFSQTDLGASYSVWIPWDAVGGDQTRVSLVPSFRAKSGKLVQGEQALVGLPGKRRDAEKIAARPNAASILAASKGDGRSGLVTTTIPVHSTLVRDRVAPGLPVRNPIPAEAIVNDTTSRPKSFDVAPLGLTAAATPPLATSESKPASRPLRLGQRGRLSERGVVRASATLPIE